MDKSMIVLNNQLVSLRESIIHIRTERKTMVTGTCEYWGSLVKENNEIIQKIKIFKEINSNT